MLCIAILVRVAPSHAPGTYQTSWKEKFDTLKRVWPCILLIAAIIFGLYSGVATPAEDSAIGAFLAAVIGFSMKRLTVKTALASVRSMIKSCLHDLPDHDRRQHLRLLHDAERDPGRRGRLGHRRPA